MNSQVFGLRQHKLRRIAIDNFFVGLERVLMVHPGDIAYELDQRVRKTWTWRYRKPFYAIREDAMQAVSREVVACFNLFSTVDDWHEAKRTWTQKQRDEYLEAMTAKIQEKGFRPPGVPVWLWMLAIKIAVELILRWYFQEF